MFVSTMKLVLYEADVISRHGFLDKKILLKELQQFNHIKGFDGL